MDTRFLLDHKGLRAGWHQLAACAGPDLQAYEMDERGRAILSERPSARRQITFTDVFCQITDQLGHLAVMSAPVVTSSFGIRTPDVVWMPPERWDSFDRDDPVPFVPDLCVEVLVDSNRQQQ